MTTSNFRIKHDYLTNGYIKEQLINKKVDNLYPLELSRVISDFLGNILMKFDFVNTEELMKYIYENSKSIEIPSGVLQSYSFSSNRHTFGCSLALDTGVTYIDIQCINPGECDAIGIVSDFDECKNDVWFCNLNGYNYWWHNGYKAILKRQNSEIPELKRLERIWEKNDIITMRIDFNEWEITFFLNQNEQHTMELEKHNKYYFVLQAHLEEAAATHYKIS